MGEERSDLNSPKAIVLLNQLGMQDVQDLAEYRIKELTARVGRDIGCSQEMIDKATEFILTR